MTKIRTWQLCRTGTFGQDGATITEKDIQELNDTFTPTRPISIGHGMTHNDSFPKFGDVLAVEVSPDKQTLIGQVKLCPELDAQYNDNHFSGWSVSIPRRASDGKRYLHSLAVCGATPPKIPGLSELMAKCQYNDGDKVEVIDFNESIDYEEESSMMTPEEQKQLEELKKENEELKKKAGTSKPAAAAPAKSECADLAPAGKPADDTRFSDLTKRCADLEAANRQARIDNFNTKVSGRIPAGVMPKVQAIASSLADCGGCEYADNGKTVQTPALDAFADVLASFKPSDDVTKPVFNPESPDFSDGKDGSGKPIDWTALAQKM